jgi:hypothetical protein
LLGVYFRCTNYTEGEFIEEQTDENTKLYSTIKPHAAISILVLGIISLSTFSANAIGHEKIS